MSNQDIQKMWEEINSSVNEFETKIKNIGLSNSFSDNEKEEFNDFIGYVKEMKDVAKSYLENHQETEQGYDAEKEYKLNVFGRAS